MPKKGQQFACMLSKCTFRIGNSSQTDSCQHCRLFICTKTTIPIICAYSIRSIVLQKYYYKSSAINLHLSDLKIWMGQGYMPKVCLSGMRGNKVIELSESGTNITILYTCISLRTLSTFHLQPRKQLHTLSSFSVKFTIQSVVTSIFTLIELSRT